MAEKELKLKVAEAIQDDVNKGNVTIVPDLYLRWRMEVNYGWKRLETQSSWSNTGWRK